MVYDPNYFKGDRKSLADCIQNNIFDNVGRRYEISRVYGNASGETLMKINSNDIEEIVNFSDYLHCLDTIMRRLKVKKFYDNVWESNYKVLDVEKGNNGQTLARIKLEGGEEKVGRFCYRLYNVVVE